MKNFFQRKQDAQPNPRSNTPVNEAYRIWLPRSNASKAPAPAPTAWAPAPQTGARKGGETQRSSSGAPRADASSVPTSSTYKYAAVPPNSTGFYYSNPAQPVPVQPFPPQYYTSLPRPPPDRPDSRLGYAPAPYPYPNPQYPQPFTAPPPSQPAVSKRREDKPRNTVDGRGLSTVTGSESRTGQPASSRGHKDDRTPRKSSSASLREEAEVKKPKHRPREPSETRKRRDSQVVDPYAEKRREKSSRKEPRRDVRYRPDSRAEEGDSSDSSIQRPSSAGHGRRLDEGKPSVMMSSRTGLPMQPTAASSSSGKHTPQISRMPVYLPANHGRSHRPDDGQPGLSESDTDHGALNRGRDFLRGTAPPSSKPSSKHQAIPANALGGPSALTATNKKVKESKGLWPFSRSKSSQKPPERIPKAAPSTTDNPAKKIRADSTPSRFPQTFVNAGPTERPEYRRYASDNAIGSHPDRQTERATVLQQSRSLQPEVQSSNSRAMFFATQSNEPSSLPITTASQQAALYSIPSAANPGAYATAHHPVAPAASFNPRQNPVPQSGLSGPPNPIQRPETPMRRDGRDGRDTLPPIYAPPPVTRPSDYHKVLDHSTAPKVSQVSQLVAGFEARSSETQAHIPQQMARPPPMAPRRELLEKPSLSRIYAPPGQGPGNGSTPAPASAAANPHIPASQPPPRTRTTSDASIRPVAETSQPRPIVNQPDVLKTQLRDLLTDKPMSSRVDDKAQFRKAPESRNIQASALPAVYPNLTSSLANPFAQPPAQVYTAGTSESMPSKSTARVERSGESVPSSKPSSKRPDVSQSADRTSHRPADDLRDGTHSRRSRPKKDTIAVAKTPSKDSSRHTSSPSPVLIAHSTQQSRPNDKSSQLQNATLPSRSQLPPSSLGPGNNTSQRDHRPPSHPKPLRDPPPTTSSNTPTTSSSERARPVPPSMSTLPFPGNQPLPVPHNTPPRPLSRAAVAPSGSTPMASGPQSGSRPSSGNSRTVARMPSEESILKTPSSLAHSVLQPTISRTSLQASVSSERKKGLFGMFRSKETQQPETRTYETRHMAPPTQAPYRTPQPSSESVAHPTTSDRKHLPKAKVPPPITVPHPALPISERKSPNSRVFTPFRYLTSKRNRRVSTASMDAVDGTAPNTVMGSPTASMQSSQMPTQSPPQRDPRLATQDWRNQEESDVIARGKRLRPGVVFDVAEDPLEETKRSRPTRIKKSQPQAEPPTTDSSDGQ